MPCTLCQSTLWTHAPLPGVAKLLQYPENIRKKILCELMSVGELPEVCHVTTLNPYDPNSFRIGECLHLALSLMQTCKMMRDEVREVFYNYNTLTLKPTVVGVRILWTFVTLPRTPIRLLPNRKLHRIALKEVLACGQTKAHGFCIPDRAGFKASFKFFDQF